MTGLTLTIDFATILREDIVECTVLRKVYAQHPQLLERGKHLGVWIPFYTIDDLTDILDKCLIPIMEYVTNWSNHQLSKPVEPVIALRITELDKKKVIDDLNSLGMDAR